MKGPSDTSSGLSIPSKLKLRFKTQEFQTQAVEAIVNCFEGQPFHSGLNYRMDLGKRVQNVEKHKSGEQLLLKNISDEEENDEAFKNNTIKISQEQLLENVQKVQKLQNSQNGQDLAISQKLTTSEVCNINLDVEMETGTGKTYCYIKTIFELNKRYGWSKFIIVVPSIAIREGAYKNFQITTEHFQESYQKHAKFFIYNSQQLNNLESFSSDAGINVMIINTQAFNATGKDARRIYEEIDSFQSRKPIDVIKNNNPILIIDEPQKIEGDAKKPSKSFLALKEFNPLMILRYSATHKKTHNVVYRLDALDAFNKKLVKKISVRGIAVKGLAGTNSFIYCDSIIISKQDPAVRLEIEIKQKNGIKRVRRKFNQGDNLYELSGELNQYKDGFIISGINPNTNTSSIEFTNGISLKVGEVIGNADEKTLRRIQIREAINAHLEKEKVLFAKGIKVLSLFFIDEVAKYRKYTQDGQEGGEYHKMFEEEYQNAINQLYNQEGLFFEQNYPEYKKYLEDIDVADTHKGYFAIDKKKNFVDIDETKNDKNKRELEKGAYDLILRDKERLLSFDEPTRFIFSHSALREGWDNPNVFVICTLKYSSNDISRRQEVGRGLRLAVNKKGERIDDDAIVHDINELCVVANESYEDFVKNFQRETLETLSGRATLCNAEFFTNRDIKTKLGEEKVISESDAKKIERYLIKNDYIDENDKITDKYHEDKKNDTIADLPENIDIIDDKEEQKEKIVDLIDKIVSREKLPEVGNDKDKASNKLNENFHKEEFIELWDRINYRAIYTVDFDSEELIKNSIKSINKNFIPSSLSYEIIKGKQKAEITQKGLQDQDSFEKEKSDSKKYNASVYSTVQYDLIGKIVDNVKLTRASVVKILSGLFNETFNHFKKNPEHFIKEVSKLIEEQKGSVIIEHLKYDTIKEKYDKTEIFTEPQTKIKFKDIGKKLQKHIYDYIQTDSQNEKNFVNELEISNLVEVYAKLPSGFKIPTPIGSYNPDWAIAFQKGKVRHIYFVAETKGSMSSLELRPKENIKINCSKKFFESINEKYPNKNVKYHEVDSFETLKELIGVV